MLKPLSHIASNGSFNDSDRTEDVKFSPSGRILAVVATHGRILLFIVDVRSRPVHIGRSMELFSNSLFSPHGIDFLSEDIIVVANRSGCVTFYRIPGANAWKDHAAVEPIHHLESTWFGGKGATRKLRERTLRCGPGSVRVHGEELYICCNYSNTVTAHPYRIRQGRIETGKGTIVAQDGLEIPDGIALSRDGRWMAVSDHDHHRVVIYWLANRSQSCVLCDANLHYPHGLCFDRTGHRLYVADAGGRRVHVFTTKSQWDKHANCSAFQPTAVGKDVFLKTQKDTRKEVRALEGGIKGIDVDPSSRVIATTCRYQTLRFFEVDPPAAPAS